MSESRNSFKVSQKLHTNSHTTILMVNHQLELAQQFCTRVLYLQDGQLVQDVPNSNQMDWQKLRETLIQAETTAAEEWIWLTEKLQLIER